MKDVTLFDVVVALFLLTGLMMIYQDRYGWGWALTIGYILALVNNQKTPPGSDTGRK